MQSMRRGRPQVQLADPDAWASTVFEYPDSVRTTTALRLSAAARAAGLVLLALLVYLPILGHGFGIGDDLHVTQNLPLRGGAAALAAIWRHPSIMPGFGPLAYTLYMGEYRLFGATHALGYHLVSLVLHAVNVVLLWRVLEKLRLPGRMIAAGIFAVHPVVAQAVAWISAQPLLLCSGFCLACLLPSLRYLDANRIEMKASGSDEPTAAWKLFVPAMLCFAAALMCHAIAVILPIVVLVILWWQGGRHRQATRLLVPMLVMAIACAAVVWVSARHRTAAMGATGAVSISDYLAAASRLLFPIRLAPSDVADLMYLPAAALSGVIVAWVSRSMRSVRSWIPASIGAAAIAFLGIVTLVHLEDYRDTRAMWLSRLRVQPRSLVALNQLGLIDLYQQKSPSAAMARFQAALQIDPRDVQTHFNIAQIYQQSNEPDKQIAQYFQVLSIDPNNVDAHFGLAQAYYRQGRSDDALAEYNRVLELQPSHVKSINNVGLIHTDRGEFDQAIASYERAIQTDPAFTAPYLNLANLYYDQSRRRDNDQKLLNLAARTLARCVGVNPTSFEAYINGGRMLAELGDNQQAQQCFRAAVGLQPDSAIAWTNLGIVQSRLGRYEDAIYSLERAIELDPNDLRAQASLDHAQRERESDRERRAGHQR